MNWKFWKHECKEYTITNAYVKYIGPSSHPDIEGVMIIGWSAKGVGFGEIIFYRKNKKFYCETECMSKEFVKAVMDSLLKQDVNYLDQ